MRTAVGILLLILAAASSPSAQVETDAGAAAAEGASPAGASLTGSAVSLSAPALIAPTAAPALVPTLSAAAAATAPAALAPAALSPDVPLAAAAASAPLAPGPAPAAVASAVKGVDAAAPAGPGRASAAAARAGGAEAAAPATGTDAGDEGAALFDNAAARRAPDSFVGVLRGLIGRFGGGGLASARPVLDARTLDADALIAGFKKDREIKKLMEGEVYYMRYRSVEQRLREQLALLPGAETGVSGYSPALLRALVALHDIGEPRLRAMKWPDRQVQAAVTRDVARRALVELGFSERETRLGSAAASAKPVSELFSRWDDPRGSAREQETALKEAVAKTRALARTAGARPQDLLPALVVLGMVDILTTSQPLVDGTRYVERGAGGALALTPRAAAAVAALTARLAEGDAAPTAPRAAADPAADAEAARALVAWLERRFDAAFARTSGFSSFEEFRSALRATPQARSLAAAIERGDYALVIAAPSNLRETIAREGFKNAHQTGSNSIHSGAQLADYIAGRSRQEARLTGMTPEQYDAVPPGVRPISLFLVPRGADPRSVRSSLYGSDIYVVKPEAVRGRATFTLGDSLNNSGMSDDHWEGTYIPLSRLDVAAPLLLDAAARARGDLRRSWKVLSYRRGNVDFDEVLPRFPGALSRLRVPWIRSGGAGFFEPVLPTDYVEAQVFGPLPATAISRFVPDANVSVDPATAGIYRGLGVAVDGRR